jgi:Tfp pilus assembly protein PilN
VTRVNLLRSVPNPLGNPDAPDRRRAALAGRVILSLTACSLGVWAWVLYTDASRLDRELARGRDELSRLRKVVADAVVTGRAAHDLQQRIDALGELRDAQRAPVRILEAIDSALPGDCWLTVLMEDPANTLRIEGRAPALSSLLEMVEQLERSAVFRGVEVLDSHTRDDDADGDAIGFSLKALLRTPAGVVSASDASVPGHTPASNP